MKGFAERYLAGLLFTILPLVWMVWSYKSYAPLSADGTAIRQGKLSAVPKFDETGGESSKPYIELRFSGSDERYRFMSCSYNNDVAAQVKLLTVGDSLTLLVEHSSDQDYHIRQAWSPRVDTILTLDSYNRCDQYKAKVGIPTLAGVYSLFGVVMLVNAFINSRRDKYILDIPQHEVNSITIPLGYTGDALTYISRNSIWPLAIAGVAFLGGKNMILLSIAAFYFVVIIIASIGRKYLVDEEGVHVTSRSLFRFFKSDTATIKYEEIDEVSFRTSVFERWKGIGSVLVTRDKKEGEEDAMSVQLHGIPNAGHVARLILDLSKAKRVGKV